MTHVGRNGIRKRGLGILVAAAGLLAVPAAANASTISFDGTTVHYTAATSETNQLAITANGTDLFFSDAGATAIIDGDGRDGCSVFGNTATCTLTSFVTTDVQLGGRNDTATATGNLAPLTALRVDGSAGADTLGGGNGADLLLGGTGADHLDGNQGADTALAGAGNDTFQWDPGDGSDVLEGQEDRDTLRFNGSNINEQIELSANGPRLRMTRDIAAVTLDADGVEVVTLGSFGGADTATVDDLTGTDVTDFTDDLAAIGGGGDGAADQVIVNGTTGPDHPTVSAVPTGARVNGLAPRVTAINGEPANDRVVVNGLAGDDQLTANPDVGAPIGVHFDGGGDTDTAVARGTSASDAFAVVANGTSAFVTGTGGVGGLDSVAERLQLQMLGASDTVSAAGNLAAITAITVDGGAGNDTIGGSNGADILLGGSGLDFIDGNQGSDTAFGGLGDDTFQWDPGDGSDVLEGQENRDTLRFNGSNINEQIELSANGPRLRMTRDIAAVTLDADGVEVVTLGSFGGADTTTVDDLTGTDVTDFTDDLGALGGGGDGSDDQVIVNGTDGDDAIAISGSTATGVDATGLAPAVHIRGQEPTDRLVVHTLHGTDSFNDDALDPGTILFSID